MCVPPEKCHLVHAALCMLTVVLPQWKDQVSFDFLSPEGD